MTQHRTALVLGLFGVLLIAGLITGPSHAASAIDYWTAQTVYIPLYSQIYSGDREQPVNLTATLSIRNTDTERPITVLSADYHDAKGALLNQYIESPVNLGPLNSIRYVVKESDIRGGSGACFLVKWKADQKVRAPIIESIMISTRSQQGISFVSRGQVVAGTEE